MGKLQRTVAQGQLQSWLWRSAESHCFASNGEEGGLVHARSRQICEVAKEWSVVFSAHSCWRDSRGLLMFIPNQSGGATRRTAFRHVAASIVKRPACAVVTNGTCCAVPVIRAYNVLLFGVLLVCEPRPWEVGHIRCIVSLLAPS